MAEGLKPEEQWDTADRLDHLDGWHEASDVGFKSKRDPERVVKVYDPNDRQLVTHTHKAAALLAAGPMLLAAGMMVNLSKTPKPR